MRIVGLAALPALFLLTSCVVVESDRPGPPPRDRDACLMIYDPVCGRVGRRTQTFGNSCEANAAGAEIVNRG